MEAVSDLTRHGQPEAGRTRPSIPSLVAAETAYRRQPPELLVADAGSGVGHPEPEAAAAFGDREPNRRLGSLTVMANGIVDDIGDRTFDERPIGGDRHWLIGYRHPKRDIPRVREGGMAPDNAIDEVFQIQRDGGRRASDEPQPRDRHQVLDFALQVMGAQKGAADRLSIRRSMQLQLSEA